MSAHRRIEARNRGLERVSRLTSLTLSGGLVLSGGFAVLADHAYAGHSRHAVRTAAQTTSATAPILVPDPSLLTPATTTTTTLRPPTPATNTATRPRVTTAPTTTATTVPQTAPPVTFPITPPTAPIVSSGS